jgi:hypothetical protein
VEEGLVVTAPARVTETEAVLNSGDLDDLEHLVCEDCRPALDRGLCGALMDPDEETCEWASPCPHVKCLVCHDLLRTHTCLGGDR